MLKGCETSTPPRPGPGIEVLRVKTRDARPFRILSARFYGPFVHWKGKRSIRCRDPRETCPGCQQQLPRKWKGYLHAIREDDNTPVILELTPRSATMLQKGCPEGRTLRGLRVWIARSSDGDHGRLRVQVIGYVDNLASLEDERDPRPVLAFLWGEDVDFGN